MDTPAIRNRQRSIRPNEPLGAQTQSRPKLVSKAPQTVRSASDAGYSRTLELVNALAGLTASEQRELATCEAVIGKGWQTFVTVGEALAQIRDKKLYRLSCDTFEGYCRNRRQYGRSHVYRLIGAAQVFAHLSPIGDNPGLANEPQVRPLIGLAPDQAKAAWEKGVEKAKGAMISAKVVKEAVAETVDVLSDKSRKGRESAPKLRENGDTQPVQRALDVLQQIETSVQQKVEVTAVLSLIAQVRKHLDHDE